MYIQRGFSEAVENVAKDKDVVSLDTNMGNIMLGDQQFSTALKRALDGACIINVTKYI